MVLLRYWGSHFKTRRQVDVLLEEFRPLVHRGWECNLVLEREVEELDWVAGLTMLGVRFHLVPRPSRKFDLRCIIRAMRLCNRINPDVIICENIHSSPLIGATIARVPVRIWLKRAMNSAFERGDQPDLWNRFAPSTRLSCRLATRVIAVSSAVREELIGLGIKAEKVLVRPNPRRLGELKTTATMEGVRRALKLADSDVIWVSIGNAVPVKGWDMLIRAFDQVAKSDARAQLLLVGGLDRPEEKATTALLRSEIERLGLRSRVTLTGHVEDVASLLKASDGFVMSSHSEGFSNALIEALEAGLPCVATRVGIAADVIHPEANGLLVDRLNEAALADALILLTCNDATRARLARNAVVPESIPTLSRYAEGMALDLEALRNEMTREPAATTKTTT